MSIRQKMMQDAKDYFASKEQKTFNSDEFIPYYNLKPGQNIELRILPVSAEDKDAFFVRDVSHNLITGYRRNDKGEIMVDKEKNPLVTKKRVACLKALGHEYCPACARAAKIYKMYTDDEAEIRKEMYAKFKKKDDYMLQGYIVNIPEKDEFKIKKGDELISRKGTIGIWKYNGMVQDVILKYFNDGDFWGLLDDIKQESPIEWGNNYNFKINATAQTGTKYNTYSTSGFAMKATVVSEPDEYTLYDLSQHCAKVVPVDELEKLVEVSWKFINGESAGEVTEEDFAEEESGTRMTEAAPSTLNKSKTNTKVNIETKEEVSTPSTTSDSDKESAIQVLVAAGMTREMAETLISSQ